MAPLIDTPQNTKIVYLWINKFAWSNDMDKEQSVGHPKPKHLYRGVYNKDTETYRFVYKMGDIFQGTFLKSLTSDDETAGYTSDIVELSLSNILDSNLSEKDLKMLLEWIDTDNKDLKEKLWAAPKRVNLDFIDMGTDIATFFADTIKKSDPEFTDFIAVGSSLREINPSMFEAVHNIISYLIEDEYTEVEDDSSISPRWISMDVKLGAGANLYGAIQKLARYGSVNTRVSRSKEDLLGAIKDLLVEQQRRNLHNLR